MNGFRKRPSLNPVFYFWQRNNWQKGNTRASTFFNKKNSNTLIEPMFFGNSVNVARFDKQKFEIFEKIQEEIS
jgi:hypothetical protein